MRERERKRLTGFDPTRIRPATLTRSDLTIPATSPADQGTDMKLESRPSYPSRHRLRNTGNLAWKNPQLNPFFHRRSRRIVAAPLPGSCSSSHTHHFPTYHDHRGRRLGRERPPGNSRILELRSAAVAARGLSPAAPLDSPRSELSDLSFLSSLTEVRSSLTGRGNSVISQKNLGVNL